MFRICSRINIIFMVMPFTITKGTMVHFMTVSMTLWLGCNQFMIRQSVFASDANTHHHQYSLITLSGWYQSLLLIDMGVMLLIFAVCQVVSVGALFHSYCW